MSCLIFNDNICYQQMCRFNKWMRMDIVELIAHSMYSNFISWMVLHILNLIRDYFESFSQWPIKISLLCFVLSIRLLDSVKSTDLFLFGMNRNKKKKDRLRYTKRPRRQFLLFLVISKCAYHTNIITSNPFTI